MNLEQLMQRLELEAVMPVLVSTMAAGAGDAEAERKLGLILDLAGQERAAAPGVH